MAENVLIPTIPRSEMTPGRLLGQGGFGSVLEGNKEGKMVALKILHAPVRVEKYAEFNFLAKLKHKNLVKLLGIVDTGLNACPELVYQFIPGESLLDFVKKNICSKKTLVKIGFDIINGMEYLHNMNCLHRTLAARNILMDGNCNAKISDFGLGKILDGEGSNYYKIDEETVLPIRWVPKECIPSNSNPEPVYGREADVWAYGVVIWEAASKGDVPYGAACSNSQVRQLIQNGSSPLKEKCPENCPAAILKLMESIFEEDPTKRPTFMDLRKRFQEMYEKETKPPPSKAEASGSSAAPTDISDATSAAAGPPTSSKKKKSKTKISPDQEVEASGSSAAPTDISDATSAAAGPPTSSKKKKSKTKISPDQEVEASGSSAAPTDISDATSAAAGPPTSSKKKKSKTKISPDQEVEAKADAAADSETSRTEPTDQSPTSDPIPNRKNYQGSQNPYPRGPRPEFHQKREFRGPPPGPRPNRPGANFETRPRPEFKRFEGPKPKSFPNEPAGPGLGRYQNQYKEQEPQSATEPSPQPLFNQPNGPNAANSAPPAMSFSTNMNPSYPFSQMPMQMPMMYPQAPMPMAMAMPGFPYQFPQAQVPLQVTVNQGGGGGGGPDKNLEEQLKQLQEKVKELELEKKETKQKEAEAKFSSTGTGNYGHRHGQEHGRTQSHFQPYTKGGHRPGQGGHGHPQQQQRPPPSGGVWVPPGAAASGGYKQPANQEKVWNPVQHQGPGAG